MKIDSKKLELNQSKTDDQTDKRRLALLELLSEPKIAPNTFTTNLRHFVFAPVPVNIYFTYTDRYDLILFYF